MPTRPASLAAVGSLLLLPLPSAAAQEPLPASSTPAPASVAPPPPLFLSTAPLVLELATDLRGLLRDRGDKRIEHDAMMRLREGADSASLKVELRTRGIFRLNRCAFPPLRVDLPRTKVEGTPFAGQDKLKLVTHCQSGRAFERNLLREYALYRVFSAVTDTSFKTRLARVTYIDTSRAPPDTLTRYAFFIEADAALAGRLGGEVVELDNVHDLLADTPYMTLVAVFQYLIGNTDWSVWGRHNIAIMRDSSGKIFAVPYDFDFAGAVSAPYAAPPPQLPIRSVRERLYRGYCQPDTVLLQALARFRSAKDSIYSAVRSVPDLDPRDTRDVLGYFDDFYEVIDNPGRVRWEFVRRCRQPPR